MRSVFRSSPPGAPRSMVRALSMPRPAYIAAHSPAGPAPTMITSYPCLALSVIRPQLSVRNTQLQSWRLGLAGQRSRQLLAKPNCFDFDIGPLRARQLVERRLDQSLPNGCRGFVAVTNNRTPNGFQGLVGEPVFPGVEQIASSDEDRSTSFWCHGRQKAAGGGTGTPTAAPCRPLPPRSAASSGHRDTN